MVTVHRPTSLVLLVIALLSACTSHRTRETTGEPERGSEQEPPVASPTPSPTPSPSIDSPTPWRWIHRGEEGGWSADIGPKSIHAGALTCTHQHDDRAHDVGKVCCEGAGKRWCVEMREDFVPGISLASDGQRLFVADYPAISSGARLAAYELETGSMLWTRDALAIGPQAHSEYFNVVQLRLVGERLIAYGDEAHGAYAEAMDPASGSLLEHATLEPPQVAWSWSDAPEPEPELTLALADGGECHFQAGDDTPSRLRCTPAGASGWTQEFESDFVGRGAMVSDGQRVVVVTWCRIANGARARAWTLADGTLAWDRSIEGIGPQDHSKYSNLIQIALDGELVLVRGQESHGRYVEALELDSGALRWTVAWPAF
jgi:hypothetical protein